MTETQTPACMGGWCASKRDTCASYHAKDTNQPAERLCVPGETNAWQPIELSRPAATDKDQLSGAEA